MPIENELLETGFIPIEKAEFRGGHNKSSPPGGRAEPLVQSTRSASHDSDSGRLLNSMLDGPK